jgi:hypothetical protein
MNNDGMTIIPETKCDGLDNDCNGKIDDNQPNKGQVCHDAGLGICQGTGTFICDSANPTGPAVCNITQAGGTPSAEKCNGLDDDCDGTVDEGGATGSLIGQEWVNVGAGHQMMKYEASKPDATNASSGNNTTLACSQAGVQPWVNVTYPQAVAACASIGATLCSESAWHRACSVVAPSTFPIAVNGTGTMIEAEDYFGTLASAVDAGGKRRAWVEDETPGFSGISDMQALPITGGNITAANAPTQSPRLDYQINFTAAATTYRVWVHMFSAAAANNGVWVGVNTTLPGTAITTALANTTTGTWEWIRSVAINVPATGNRFVSLYMNRDGAKVDAIYVASNGSSPPATLNSPGGQWAYATNPNTYQSLACNGFDFNPANPGTLPTGSLASCYAADSGLPGGTANDHAFDMSGNVKEWTLAHQPGQNPIRGGAYNNTAVGIDCPLNFTLGDDTFFFPDVGFRCCR